MVGRYAVVFVEPSVIAIVHKHIAKEQILSFPPPDFPSEEEDHLSLALEDDVRCTHELFESSDTLDTQLGVRVVSG